ncbi:YopX family protein [Staphylococcus haemolyticus]|uniref:YopX family protein n=1 Tax=Staphylococcus haemolyticus TaxID=1283 RepID=UPI00069E4B9C|nr:YopX family protein [Staphylococcus haemolyticus]
MIPKFRAWDRDIKMMCDVLKIDFGNRTLFYRHWLYGVSREIDIKEVIIMQATGARYIYDEKGKEIFEGDIVKTRASEYGRFIGYVDNAISRFQVRGVKQYKGLSIDLDGTCEIIGNIYENPELLEDN